MPDLTIETYWCCESCREWSTTVESSKTAGKVYTVKFNATDHHNRDLVEHDYSCDCDAYKFKRGNYCKHIKAVKHQRCAWSQPTDGGEPVKREDGKYYCPMCGLEVFSVRYGV